jgi:hypothetical protein
MLYRALPVEIQLSENGKPPEWVQVIRTGKWKHPQYGPFEISLDTLQAFKKNFDDKVLGVDPAYDYAHQSGLEAAAWFRELKIEGNRLLARLDYTPKGAEKIANKEYRYSSADFEFNYKDPETGKTFGPVLKGAAFTNRPFIKGMAPTIELSEFTEEKEMNELEKAQAQVKTLSDENAQLKTTNKTLSDEVVAVKAEKKKLDDALEGKSPEELMTMVKELQAKVAELEGATKASEKEAQMAQKKGQFDKLLSEGKVVEAQREAFMAGDAVKLAELSQPVKLDPKGSGKQKESDVKEDKVTEAEEKITQLAQKLVDDKKAKDIGEAQSMVLSDPQHKALADEYNKKFA